MIRRHGSRAKSSLYAAANMALSPPNTRSTIYNRALSEAENIALKLLRPEREPREPRPPVTIRRFSWEEPT